MKLKVKDLFSGAGGFFLGLEGTGYYETISFCDNDPYCHKVLRKNFNSNIELFDNVKIINKTNADVVVGGFPC